MYNFLDRVLIEYIQDSIIDSIHFSSAGFYSGGS